MHSVVEQALQHWENQACTHKKEKGYVATI